MDNTNRFLIVRDSHGEPETRAYYGDSLSEARCAATEHAASDGGRWLVCVVIDESTP